LKIPFIEGDDLHPRSNIEKMSNGQPLVDEDREPWLELVRKTAERHYIAEMQIRTQSNHGDGDRCGGGGGVVITCSALKKCYRDILRGRLKPFSTYPSTKRSESLPEEALLPLVEPPNPESFPTYFIFITGRQEVILKRMMDRKLHFMKPDMLQSQLDTLESPEGEDGVVTVDVEESTEIQVLKAKQGIAAIAGEWFIQRFNNSYNL
jgi:gluconokinase